VIRRIKVCLNGGRRRSEHPAVPLTPGELARSATDAVAAGAEAVHAHPRDDRGGQTLSADHIGAAVAAIRAALPGTPVGVSTGLWIAGDDPAVRLAAVSGWAGLSPAERPDFASVNVHEPGFVDLCAALGEMGIDVEAGVWSVAAADALAGSGVVCVRLLVEVLDTAPVHAVRVAPAILNRLDAHGLAAPRLLHGDNASTWALVELAGRLGLPTRIGLEDTLLDPHGEPAHDNADLVRIALAHWSAQRPH
jgi:uncharacterized protein (DUF849 family)